MPLEDQYKSITEEDVRKWEPYALSYLKDILTGEYDLKEAREDVISLRKSKHSLFFGP